MRRLCEEIDGMGVINARALALRSTRLWVERVVVGLSLCPWARAPSVGGTIRYAFTVDDDHEQLLTRVRSEVLRLRDDAPDSFETTLLVAPRACSGDFLEFCGLVQDAEAALSDEGLEEEFQLVGFHPQHCFAGEAHSDAGNFVNRSPYPMVHILRQDDVTRAVDSHPDSLEVPNINRRQLKALGAEHMQTLLNDCCAPEEL